MVAKLVIALTAPAPVAIAVVQLERHAPTASFHILPTALSRRWPEQRQLPWPRATLRPPQSPKQAVEAGRQQPW